MSRQMWSKLIQLAAACLVLLLVCQNQAACDLIFFGITMKVSSGIAFFVGYLLCLAATLISARLACAGEKANEKRIEQWQSQDAKLALEVQSDKEKQLEAKIATLEAALQRALKK